MHSDYNVYRVRSRYNSDWGETGTEQEEQEDSDESSYCQPDVECSETRWIARRGGHPGKQEN